jgi:rare lipoprotein A
VRHMTLARACVLGMTIACAASVPAAAQSDSQGTMKLHLADASVRYDKPVVAQGRLDGAHAGREVVLEFRSRGAWAEIARTAVAADGAWRLSVALPRTALIRATLLPAPGSATAAAAPRRSRERRVAVMSVVDVAKRRLAVKAGRAALVTGTALPAASGRKVALQVRTRGRWRTLDRDRTSADGRYRLRERTRIALDARARVVVAGGQGLSKTPRKVGRLTAFRYAHASWYGPGFYGQQTGCGGRLGYSQYGVAHKTLPCGTMVTLRHRGRVARVPVMDRGPYIAGREFDLTSVTARKLHFRGHGAILVSR